jgi:hypothetical protein
LKTAVEQACLRQSGLNPEMASTGRAFQVVASLHFDEPGPNIFDVTAINQPAKSGDTRWTSNEKLNSARVTGYVRLFLLCDSYFARRRTDRTGKHPISI